MAENIPLVAASKDIATDSYQDTAISRNVGSSGLGLIPGERSLRFCSHIILSMDIDQNIAFVDEHVEYFTEVINVRKRLLGAGNPDSLLSVFMYG